MMADDTIETLQVSQSVLFLSGGHKLVDSNQSWWMLKGIEDKIDGCGEPGGFECSVQLQLPLDCPQ
jgi:hypothetical protein